MENAEVHCAGAQLTSRHVIASRAASAHFEDAVSNAAMGSMSTAS
jgi:hypothetical protein